MRQQVAGQDMTAGSTSPLGFRAGLWLAAGAALLVAGCEATSVPGRPALSIREETAQFRSAPDSRRWIPVAGALLTQERDLGGDVEQRIALPNATTIEGDNMMVLRARAARGTALPRLGLSAFADAEGRLPQPFATLATGDLRSGEDALGSVVHAERRFGVDTVCVLALRRMPPTARPLPAQAEVLDVMLRNCVRGRPEDALRPISAPSLGFPGVAPAGGEVLAQGAAGRTRSPLAAPLP
ncbi:hypothetical protein LAZ40_15790 [Cereibacter sphaeroides]|uniref:hypothetical protein n=1 Tax=Cereibacter sphaeroides TaxID=1063 RepID=UPI001F32471B|nr:hypothetical protein [Cereibacter sphaeroides]MCE6960487.1 hypothetical protein [Cereibacter sphaeroides]MCE6969437.1 hypothetical protein [Cereibacter sphaeroides]MCE6975495.1 hypothetical protein [Cereibacter sphaeroides]